MNEANTLHFLKPPVHAVLKRANQLLLEDKIKIQQSNDRVLPVFGCMVKIEPYPVSPRARAVFGAPMSSASAFGMAELGL